MMGYFIQSGVLLAVYYLVYVLFLRKQSRPEWARAYLLTGMLASSMFPLIPSFPVPAIPPGKSFLLEVVQLGKQLQPGIPTTRNPLHWLAWIYGAGGCWFALRLSSGLSKLVFFYIRFPKTTVRGTRAVMVPGKLAPFTFFNLLFISPVHLGQPGMQGVLEHELAHIRKWHSMDVLAHRRNEVG